MTRAYRRRLRIAAAVVAVPIIWVLVFFAGLLNWGHLTAAQLEVKYSLLGHPQGRIVLAGSSTMQVWTDASADLGPLRTENLGIGGTVTDSWPPLVDRLIAPLAPAAVVLYLGANDLHNDRADPAVVAEKLARLVEQIHAAAPEARIYWVSVYTTLAHSELQEQDRALNQQMVRLAETVDYLRYIDVATPLLGDDGLPRGDAFLADGVHLGEIGYRIFGAAIRYSLHEDFPRAEAGER